jgi:hypothetical protein
LLAFDLKFLESFSIIAYLFRKVNEFL